MSGHSRIATPTVELFVIVVGGENQMKRIVVMTCTLEIMCVFWKHLKEVLSIGEIL